MNELSLGQAPGRARMGAALAAAAAGSALLAAYNVYRARRSKREYPPRGRFVVVDSVCLHYVERGEGPAVVLLHGNVVTADDFALSGVLDLASRHYRVIAFDRPGYGYSHRPRAWSWTPARQADCLHRACKRLGIENAVIVGHSLGTQIALALALKFPSFARGLVLLSGYYHPTRRFDVAVAKALASPVFGDAMRYTLAPLLSRAFLPLIFKTMFAPCEVDRRFENGFPNEFPVRPSQLRAQGEDGAGMISAAAAMEPRYRRLKIPVAIMAGADDRVVNIGRHSRRLQGEIGDSMFELIPGAGHMVHYAAPGKVVDAISRVDRLALRTNRAP